MKRLLPFVISGLFFLVATAFFSRGLEFPPYYHPDEINKVMQIRDGDRNFHHPQLLLNTGALIDWIGGSPKDTLEIAKLSRWASVLFAAATVALLAYAAYLLGGVVAQLACGWIILTEPKLFELAHYLKEDPALAMGFAAIYVAFILYDRKPAPGRVALVGLAAAVAISAKYIGVYPALLALLGVAWHSFGKASIGGRRDFWICIVVCLVAMAAINWQVIVEFARFQYGLGREVALFQDKAVSVINPKTFGAVREEIGFLAWLAALAWLAVPLYQGRRLRLSEWLILVATFGYAVMLVVSSRAASRYLLPINVSLGLIIPVAACWVGAALARLFRKPRPLGELVLCVPLVIMLAAVDIPTLQRLYAGFQGDTRLELVKVLQPRLKADSVIAEDRQAKLPTALDERRSLAGWDLTQEIIRPEENPRLADDFTVAQLREKGVTHVVLLIDGTTRSALKDEEKKLSADEKRIKNFITELDAEGEMLWSCDSGSPAYINPALRLYELPSAHP